MATKYRIKSDHAVVSAAQKEFDEANHKRKKDDPLVGTRPLDATVFEGERWEGEGFKRLDTLSGHINVEVGCTVMTDPDGNQFAVHPDDLAAHWEAVS